MFDQTVIIISRSVQRYWLKAAQRKIYKSDYLCDISNFFIYNKAYKDQNTATNLKPVPKPKQPTIKCNPNTCIKIHLERLGTRTHFHTYETSLWLIRRIGVYVFVGFRLVYRSICRTFYCPADLFIGLSIALSIHIYRSICRSIYRSIYRFIDLSIVFSKYLSIY